MSNYMTWTVYLGSVYDNPEGIEAVGQFLNGDVTVVLLPCGCQV